MPFGPILMITGYVVSVMNEEGRFQDRQLMQADDEGMVERFITLEGIKEPRMLSWAEERALRADLHDWGSGRRFLSTRLHDEDVTGWPGRIPGHYEFLPLKMTNEEWNAQYQQKPVTVRWCGCADKRVASCVKSHRVGGERYFECYTCHLPIFGEERY